jgi:lipoprotein-releasing system permease protein
LNLEYFIARRLISGKDNKQSISAPIITIAISAIAIGLIMMLVSVATGIGLQEKIREKIAAFSGHIEIANFDENQSKVSTQPISLNQKFYPKFKNIDGISHIQGVATKAGIIRTATNFEGVIFKGVGNEYNWTNLQEYLIAGKLPHFSGAISNEILISEYLANRLNLKLNDNFNTFFMKEGENKLPNIRVFKIIGIYNSGFQEFDATFMIGDIRHIQKLNHWQSNQVGNFEVFVTDFEDIEKKGNEIYKEIPPTLNAKTIAEKYVNIFEWLKLFDFNILTIIVIMIIVSTINIVVALLVLILERTQMIGILKALGANNWSIRKIFIYNATHLILRGLLWGNAIGIGLILIQKYFKIIKLPPENYYVNVAPVSLNFGYIFLLNVGTMVVCLLVLLIPSYIITKITPVKAIRFD